MTALAGDLHLFATCIFTEVATIFFAGSYVAFAGLVGAFAFFLLAHDFLLPFGA